MTFIFRVLIGLLVASFVLAPAAAATATPVTNETTATVASTPTPTVDAPQVQDTPRPPQPVGNPPDQTPQDTPREATVTGTAAMCDEIIDKRTRLCNAEYKNGTIHITLLSDGSQILTLTDAGGALERGEVARRRVTVPDERRVTIAMPATSVRNQAAVTIDTGNTLYAVPVSTGTELIGGPWSVQDARLSAIGAALAVSTISVVVTWRRLSGRGNEPERIA